MYYKNSIQATGHTPLVELKHISPSNRIHILAKLEGQNLGGSFSIKDRIARYMIEKAEADGKLTKDKVILEASSGNTGIALAILGKHKGYKVTIVMPSSMSVERRKLLRIYGANIVLTDGEMGMEGAIDKAREMVTNNDNYFMPDQFTNPANPLAHYETTGPEILKDFPYERIDAFVIGLGTGGTLTGAGHCLREKFPDVEIVSIEPPATDPIQGLRCLAQTFVPPVIDLSIINQQTTVTSRQAAKMAARLITEEGIFVGMSAGAVTYRAIELARQMDEGNIVAVLPDGGWKYMSLNFWTEKG
jgi:cysteine synthase B